MKNYKKMYDNYKKDYDYKKVHNHYGVGLTPMLSYDEFKFVYDATYNDRVQDIKDGKRKTVGAISRDIITSQMDYSMNYNSAKGIYKAAKELGLKVTKKDILTDLSIDQQVFDAIKNRRSQLKKMGKYGKELESIISQEFFYGSK